MVSQRAREMPSPLSIDEQPISIAANDYELIEIGDIIPDKRQARTSFRDIPRLAESIAEYGLLQNLVVHHCPHLPGKYELDAGERRFRAIQLLISQDRWKGPVLCLVRTREKDLLTGLIENIARHDVPWWRLGYKFSEAIEAGYTQRAIAEAVGRSEPFVSTCVVMARQLAPSVVVKLDRLGENSLTRTQLLRIANLTKIGTTEPDEAWQHKQLEKYLHTPRRRKPKSPMERPLIQIVFLRYSKLKSMGSVGPPLSAVIDAFVDYLEGKSPRLKLPGFDLTAITKSRKRRKRTLAEIPE